MAGLRIVCGNGFEQLERCCSHDLDSHIRQSATSVHDIDEEDEDSDYPYLESETDDEDEGCKEEEAKEEEDEEEGEGSDSSASGTDASLLGVNSTDSFQSCLSLLAFIPIYITVEKAIDSNEFDQDGFALLGPIIWAHHSLAICVVDRTVVTESGSRVEQQT